MLSAYQNKVGVNNIKLELPVKDCATKIAVIVPITKVEREVAAIFDSYLEDVRKNNSKNFLNNFVSRFLSEY